MKVNACQSLKNTCLVCRRAVPYQPNSAPPQNAYKGPLMVIYKKVMLCYISRLNGLQNILIADAILAEPGP